MFTFPASVVVLKLDLHNYMQIALFIFLWSFDRHQFDRCASAADTAAPSPPFLRLASIALCMLVCLWCHTRHEFALDHFFCKFVPKSACQTYCGGYSITLRSIPSTASCKGLDSPFAGRILNRFSSDTSTADDALPFTLNILLANLFGLVGTILVLCLSEPYLLLALIPLAILYKYLQTYYRHTARELRRLNSIARWAYILCMLPLHAL